MAAMEKAIMLGATRARRVDIALSIFMGDLYR
jgi:hypothetical protein